MREEITEPRHWRSARKKTASSLSQPSVVDEAFALHAAGETIGMRGSRRDCPGEDSVESPTPATLHSETIIQSLSQQLDMLEAQQKQLARLLDQARGN